MVNTIQKTLLDIVQEIVSDLDSDNVNSISDTDEAYQVARIVQNTYYDLVANRRIPELEELTKLESLADSTRPTYLKLPTNVSSLKRIDYNISDDSNDYSYRNLCYKEPEAFLDWITIKSAEDTNTIVMPDINGNTTLMIRNNKMPTSYTSFDDLHIVCDSYDSSVDSVLQTSKTRALVKIIPTFNLTDTFTPDLDSTHFRFLINEAKSTAMAILHKSVNPKIEQQARRQRVFSQNDIHRAARNKNSRTGYGRT